MPQDIFRRFTNDISHEAFQFDGAASFVKFLSYYGVPLVQDFDFGHYNEEVIINFVAVKICQITVYIKGRPINWTGSIA